MKLDGFDPVPWYSSLKRSMTAGTPSDLSAAKYSSDCPIGVRRSSSPVMSSVGVLTLFTYMSGECSSHGRGSSQNGGVKRLNPHDAMSVVPAKLIQSVTGARTAAAANRSVWPMIQLESTPPPLTPVT